MDAIFHRTSVRKFLDKPVEPEKIDKILRAAMQAPSACNQQPWEFYVVTDKEVLRMLSEVSPYAGPARNAPVAIVLCYRKNIKVPDYADIDLAIATEKVMLEADSLGLGSVMLGISPIKERMEAVRNAVGIDESLEAFTVVPIGYPEKINQQIERYDKTRIHIVD